MTNYSDNNKPQIKLEDYLPEVYRSDINKTLSEMVFNRHFTKDDTSRVVGYAGVGSPNAVLKRQIQEVSYDTQNTAHRQAYQLTPTMYSKVGTIETALSFDNFLTQLELQGVDRNRLPLWANATNFNWVPPINIDMLANYQDYFWVGDSSADIPQYFTIENDCNKSTDKVTAYEILMQHRGLQFPIVAVNFVTNSFIISGKLDNIFSAGFSFATSIATTPNLADKTWTVLTVQYDSVLHQTVVKVSQQIAPQTQPLSPAVGDWYYDIPTNSLYVWDSTQWVITTDPISAQVVLPAIFPINTVEFATNSFVVSGKQNDIFTATFVFSTEDTAEVNLLNKFWTTASSTYNTANDTTTIVVIEPIALMGETPPTATFDGEWWFQASTNTLRYWSGTAWVVTSTSVIANISLSAMLTVYQAQLNCKCFGQHGWDIGQWDDNSIGNVAWNTSLLASISHPTEAAWLSHNAADPNYEVGGVPVYLALWYDTTLDQLKQYSDRLHKPIDPGFAPAWLVVARNFSTVLTKTNAQERWDLSTDCVTQELNQWSAQNRWTHKSAIKSFANAKRAQLPILEYDSRMELNEWTYVQRSWKYRRGPNETFASVTTKPSHIELEPIKGYYADNVAGIWYLYLFDKNVSLTANVDYTDTFVPGYKFRVVGDDNFSAVYTVAASEFRNTSTSLIAAVAGNYMVTVVTLVEDTFTASVSGGGINNYRIIPSVTSVGDNWSGYHLHWVLDTTTKVTTPVKHQQQNVFMELDRITPVVTDPVLNNPAYSVFEPQVGAISYGSNHQEFTVDFLGITTVDLISSLQYSAVVTQPYATPGSNELRVYINGVRQYGTYTETVQTASVNYTAVGIDTYPSFEIHFVSAIKFISTVVLKIGDTVRIEVGPASFHDMGNYNLPVRTVENDALFDAAVLNLSQPVYMSLTDYEFNEQTKEVANQYPLFNIFNLLTGELINAAPVLSYVEDPSAPINGAVQRRILKAATGVEYEFKQDLVEKDNGMLYGFRQASTFVVGTYWYSSLTNRVLYWDGYAWTDHVILTANTGTVVRKPVVSSTDPQSLWTVDQALWLNTNNSKLYRRQTSNSTWIEITNLIVNAIDPTLQTVWQRGTGTNEYVPQYVDANKTPIAVGSLNGDWGVVNQWIYNPEHKNKQTILYSQIITHLTSIIKQQPPVQGLLGGGTYSNTQAEYDYSVGGTIQEYNGAFDTLISSVNVTNTTPVGVIEFAAAEYAANIRYVRDIFNRSIVSLLTQHTTASLLDLSAYVTTAVINIYEESDATARVYGDTSAYDSTTNTGVRNWIATAPIFGLAPASAPYLISDDLSLMQIVHHDGHRTNIAYTSGEEDAFARQIISTPDTRAPGYNLGQTGTTVPPASETAFVTAFGGTLRTGVFWYQTGSGTRTFYRFDAYTISPIHPSFYVNGVEIVDGAMYYNTVAHLVYVKTGLTWVQHPTAAVGDISPLWQQINFQTLLGDLYLEIENRLYARCQNVTQVFDYSTLTPNASEQAVYDALYKARFEQYVVNFAVSTPYVNTQYRQTDAFTWNYLTSTILTPPHAYTAPIPAASWQQIYTDWYNTPYPHLEPWALQGYNGKPSWWDAEYLDTTHARRWKFTYNPTMSGLGTGMWENIRTGVVPAGRTYPNGMISTGNPVTDGQSLRTYLYFCVNISNATITGGYLPDQLLPPYYATNDPYNHSMFANLHQIVAPDADYVFGNGSPVEWQWNVSSQHPYDNLVIAYLMQPVRFLRASFGPSYALVNGLEVDTTFGKVYSHLDALFHGDMIDTNQMYRVNGLNQWYVNYNRFSGFDTSDNFRSLWVGWEPLLTYQFNGIIDTSTLRVSNPNFAIFDQDYNVILANNGAFKDLWVDAFDVSVLSIPPSVIQYNNQAKWKLEINSQAAIARDISYYDVKAYPFTIDPITDVGEAYRYVITGINAATKRFYVTGDVTNVFTAGTHFAISGSSFNNGTFSTISSVYEPGLDQTRINVLETVIGSSVDGVISVTAFTLPWSTGDMVVLSSTYMLPAPLVANTPYYVINNGSNQFMLAETFNDSISNNPIDIISAGTGTHTIAEIANSFQVMGGNGYSQEIWYHYALDKSKVRNITPPYAFNGIQTLINIIDGYAEYQLDSGIATSSIDAQDFDPTSGRAVNWSNEVERFINWAFGLRSASFVVNDRYSMTANVSDSTVAFTSDIPFWPNGTAIQFTSTGTLPAPLTNTDTYYVYQTGTPGVIKLSLSQDVTSTVFRVTLTTTGTGTLYAAMASTLQAYPQFEINPIRNNIWLNTPQGILADVVQGPYTDIRIKQTIFDQYGRAHNAADLLVYRQDKRSRISVVPQLPNDVDLYYVNDPYHYIHLGGGHFFLEGYEHFLLLNPYTSSNVLMYDSFLGLFTSKLDLDFFKKTEQTLRPTLGGYYMLGHQFYRNIEGSATDLQNFYDTYAGSEDSNNIKLARSLLGYAGDVKYLNDINVNSKSQFLFYRGMLHSKGSVNSVLAYINSRRFIDAQLDEVWAYKLADFGDTRARVYPEILLFADDGLVDDIRLEFLGIEDDPNGADVITATSEKGFKLVSFSDETRWNNFPEQKAEIIQPLFLNAEVNSLTRVFSSIAPPPRSHISSVDYWYNNQTRVLHVWNGTSWSTAVNNKILVLDPPVIVPTPEPPLQPHILWRHDAPCDTVRVSQRLIRTVDISVDILQSFANTTALPISNGFSVQGNLTDVIYSGSGFTVTGTLDDGTYVVDESIYSTIEDITYIVVTTPVVNDNVGGVLTYAFNDLNFYDTHHFKEGDSGLIQYVKVNSEVVRFDMSAFQGVMFISTIRPSYNQINPAKLVTKDTGSVINQITLWHPAYDWHYYKALSNIDLVTGTDPATYSKSLSVGNISGNFWNFAEVGTTWFDTSQLGYVPYYDDIINPDINTRLYSWGNLAPYGSVKVYQWVRSTVPPSQWDALALSQQGNIAIDSSVRVTGTARTTLFKRERVISAGTIRVGAPITVTIPTVAVQDGQTVFITSTSGVPDGMLAEYNYIVSNLSTVGTSQQSFTLLDSVTGLPVDAAGITSTIEVVNAGTDASPILVFQVPAGYFVDGDHIQLSVIRGGSLPTGLSIATDYVITDLVNVPNSSYQTFSLTTTADLVHPIVITDNAVGDMTATNVLKNVTIVPTFDSVPYVKQETAKQRVVGAWLMPWNTVSAFEPTIYWTMPAQDATWAVGDVVNVYQNGVFVFSGPITFNTGLNRYEVSMANMGVTVLVSDIIDVVRPLHTLTPDEATFDPSVADDGTTTIHWLEDYEYSQSTVSVDVAGTQTTQYYFWVENSTVSNVASDSADMSLLQVAQALTDMPDSYFIVQKPLDASAIVVGYGYDQPTYGTVWSMGEVAEVFFDIPIMYREAIVRNVSQYLDNNNKYMLKFTKDMALRNTTVTDSHQMDLKDIHSEWLLFRENQSNNLPQDLWNRLTESLSGVSLTTGEAVPSPDRILYDTKYGTTTQYGLGIGQTFVDKTLGINSLLTYLQDPTKDFTPIDIDDFFARHDLTTSAGITAAMVDIYNTFGAAHINGIWFEILQDALSLKSHYSGLMKTSWVALHGIQILDVNGLFDD